MSTVRRCQRALVSSPVVPLAIASALFLLVALSPFHHWDEYFYLYTMRNNAPLDVLELEPGLAASGMFAAGYFAVKLGFLTALRALIQMFGSSLSALFAIQFIFTLVIIGFVIGSYALLRELFGGRHALLSAIVLMFLPLPLYYGYKVLSGPSSLLLMAVGSWAFLRSFRARGRLHAGLYLTLAVASVFAGMTFRVYSALFFVGLIAGLLVLRDERYPWRRMVPRAAIVGVSILLLLVAAGLAMGLDLFSLIVGPLLRASGKEKVDWIVRLYAFSMFFQFFAPIVAFSLLAWRSERFRFALVWLLLSTLPVITGHEPRYYAIALLPAAILVTLGLEQLAALLRIGDRLKPAWLVWALPLTAIVLLNQLVLAPLEPYEVNQREYVATMQEMRQRDEQATVVVPWLSDYAFLRFAYPAQPIKLSLSEGVVVNAAFQQYVGAENYVGRLETLEALGGNVVYVGWTYNPAILAMRDMVNSLGLDYMSDLEASGLKDHLGQSWMWEDRGLEFTSLAQVGMYQVYGVQVLDSNDAAP